MKKILLPIHILILALIALACWSTYLWNGNDSMEWLLSLRNLFLLSVGGIITRFFIKNFISENFTARHENRIITILILFLLFDPLLPWWLFLTLSIVTETAQYFFRTLLGPLFNPAAFGALIMSLFGFLPSWWGVNPEPRFTIGNIEISMTAWLTALTAGYVAYRYRKLPILGTAFLTFSVCYFLLAGKVMLYLLLEGTLLFFFSVMVCEPKTSPVLRSEQIVYGILVGSLLSIGIYFHFLEASLIALLIANLYTGRRFLKTFWESVFARSAST